MPVGQGFDPWMLARDDPQDVPTGGGVRAALSFFLILHAAWECS